MTYFHTVKLYNPKRMKRVFVLLFVGVMMCAGLPTQVNAAKQKKTVNNPKLEKAFDRYLANKTEKTYFKLQDAMEDATFLVLVNTDDWKTTQGKTNKEILVELGSNLKFLNCLGPDNQRYLPAFTSRAEVDVWYKEKDNAMNTFVVSLFDMIVIVNADSSLQGLIINPGSLQWGMNKKQLDTFVKNSKR